MKNCIYILIIGIFIYSCSTTKNRKMDVATTDTASDTIRIANDSLEYEIIIIEPGFNSWLITQRPRGFYSETFLETRNRIYVTEYNQRVMQPQRFDPNLYLQQINYDPVIHYGYEVNYLLYNYFLYFEQQYRQRFIVTRGRRF
ncbi:hypothetical protein IWQ47_001358 [Aquimarina sp. EL_43]|uniref:DUF6146 family protein n=1 Tax=Aquimarina TaxID=290174 RepID=UPI0004717F4E|nr:MULTISPECIES: DUF6146 family protein [Aquimarina]MBG6129339.1 hypothetical protein [Aquimarina sp. EL_35]MBG6150404.1 hypothetical protein [Aquimarina sp. EL_32]MBG6168288.1 hypothetical protein [Aquimarina sp. EL_43]